MNNKFIIAEINWSNLLNYVLGLVSILGTALTIYYGRLASKLEKKKISMDFGEMLACASNLKNKILTSGYTPEVVFTPGLRGATFANLLEDEFKVNNLPVIVGISFFGNHLNYFDDTDDYEKLETERWQLLIPKLLFKQKNKKLLIVDDFAMVGDFLNMLKKKLIANGFSNDNIRIATIVTTSLSIERKYSPDFFCYEIKDTKFYFPWGQAM